MMKSYLAACAAAFFCCIPSARAETLPILECPRDGWSSRPDSTILGKVQSAYETLEGFKAKFSQISSSAALGMQESSSGDVWFKKPGMMKWHYTNPEEQIFLVRDRTVWFYQAVERQVVIDDFSHVVITDLPVAFILGVGDIAKSFTLQRTCGNKDSIILDLAGREERKDREGVGLKAFWLAIDSRSFLPLAARVLDSGENETQIGFQKLEFDGALDQTIFAAQFPRGVDTNDRRRSR